MGAFGRTEFTEDDPLVLVIHGKREEDGKLSGHAPRGELLIGRKAFKLGKTAVASLLVERDEDYEAAMSENTLLTITRIAFFGARHKRTLRRREAMLNRANRTLRWVKQKLCRDQEAAAETSQNVVENIDGPKSSGV
jgi:hypothetical protein